MEFLAGTACTDPEVKVKGHGHAVIKYAANVYMPVAIHES